ncbi:MAG: alpha/beta hydrolase [Hyphomicrobiaceae bacterium]|nr:alpha/beta hydrolase [Hyphomicrobiaceae bacterium]
MTSEPGSALKEGQPHSRYVKVDGREVHYMEWGRPGNEPVIMWHGLARTGRDFDFIAAALSDRFHLICPDTIGRGLSEWSNAPDKDYCLDAYARLAAGIADAVGCTTMHWVGTSMGGSLGIRAAATTLAGRIRRLVINDIGPTFPPAPYERIKTYIGQPPEFATVSELEAYFRTIYKPFGHHTDAQWRHLTETSMRRLPSGKVTTHYDPAIVRQMFVHPDDYEQWPHWDRITAETLVLRGIDSDLLLVDAAREMSVRGPKARIVEVAGCGHAPALNVASQIGIVRQFLEA